jgi:hypothetical protein
MTHPNPHPTQEPARGYDIERPLSCGHGPTPQPPGSLGTGYAITAEGAYICYSCADERTLADIAAASPGDRVPAALYLASDGRTITTWSGGKVMTLASKGNRHNFSRERFYLTARDAQGRTWHGTGAEGMYCTLRLTKS